MTCQYIYIYKKKNALRLHIDGLTLFFDPELADLQADLVSKKYFQDNGYNGIVKGNTVTLRLAKHAVTRVTPRFHQIHVCCVTAPIWFCSAIRSPASHTGCVLRPPWCSTVNSWLCETEEFPQ